MKPITLSITIALLLSSPTISASESKPASLQQTKISYTNSLGMHFRLIPAGTFTMGSPENEPGRDIDESQHQVTLSRPLYMQTTEVTQGQYMKVMGTNPSNFSKCGPDCPVDRVSWNDVQLFIDKLNLLTGRTYRLPTEAEFEYAARAGTSSALANGKMTNIWCEEDSKLTEMAWYCGNAAGITHPIASKKPNPWGLYDMHGNVWEWCQDAWDGDDYNIEPVTDPIRIDESEGRVIRGGSWNDYGWHARSANRDWCVPHYRNEFIGFRLVLMP